MRSSPSTCACAAQVHDTRVCVYKMGVHASHAVDIIKWKKALGSPVRVLTSEDGDCATSNNPGRVVACSNLVDGE